MQRFRFHLYDNVITRDDVGRMFPDLHGATVDAVRSARALMADTLTSRGEINLTHRIDVENDEGHITAVPFRDAVTILQ